MLHSLLSAAGTAVSVVIAVVAVGLVVFAIVHHFVRKKQGKSGCDCGCSNCPGHCSSCLPENKQEKK